MKVETYTDSTGQDWTLHRLPAPGQESTWLARRAEGDPDGDDDQEADTRAEVVAKVEVSGPQPVPSPTTMLALIMLLSALTAYFLAVPELARTYGILALCFGSISGVLAMVGAFEEIDDVNMPGGQGHHP